MLATGTTLGPYKILAPLGAGGMGEVYRAHDTRLGRDVAIKALPDAFSSDPDRLARFEREAKVLASLNHPNVAGIYGVEEADGHRYLALEYVEGETLAARLARGALPLEEAIEICLQIASGMEAAHESGIVHRDLKPGNVMITPGDQVKVVDFGLAKGKVAEREAGSAESPTMTESPMLQHSPTIGTPATLPGVILGTAAYLSPEQARGKAVDRRTDIWSFGCVLYECLTGKRAFEGETVPDLVATILKGDVDWSRLPKSTPAQLQELLRHSLEKDPRRRLRDMGDAHLALEEIREGKAPVMEAAHSARMLSPRAIAIAAIFALASAAAGIAVWNWIGPNGSAGSPGSVGVQRFSVSLPPNTRVTVANISPDGRYLVVRGQAPASGREPAKSECLYRRRIDAFKWEPIAGSENVSGFQFSPDGRWIYFKAPISEASRTVQIAKVPTDGSAPPVTVTRWDRTWVSFIPLFSGDLLITTWVGGGAYGRSYVRVTATGGAASAAAMINAPAGFDGFFEFVDGGALPKDRGVLVSATSYQGGRWHIGIGIFDPASARVRLLVDDGECPRYVSTGHLVFSRRGALLAVPFDLDELEVHGEAVAIAEGLATPEPWLGAHFGLSGNGTLLYAPRVSADPQRHLVIVDSQGRVSDWSGERVNFIDTSPVVSPDGRRAANLVGNSSLLNDIWVSELGARAARQVVAISGADCFAPVWSPTGEYLAFARQGLDEKDGIYVQSLGGGSPRRICKRASDRKGYWPTSWSPDGSVILADQLSGDSICIVEVPFRPSGDALQVPTVLLAGSPRAGNATFSPDGRYITFTSDVSGQDEVFVAPYRPGGSLGAPVMISIGGGGGYSRWGRSGEEIFYLSAERRVFSVRITRRPELSAGAPVQRWDLGQLRAYGGGVDPKRQFEIISGDRLMVVQMGEEEGQITRLDVVLNFPEELLRKVEVAGRPMGTR